VAPDVEASPVLRAGTRVTAFIGESERGHTRQGYGQGGQQSDPAGRVSAYPSATPKCHQQYHIDLSKSSSSA
jgi:hypothetical protein